MTMFIIYIASVITFNYCGYFYYKLKYKHLKYGEMDIIMSLIPLLNTIFAVCFAKDYYKELNRKD